MSELENEEVEPLEEPEPDSAPDEDETADAEDEPAAEPEPIEAPQPEPPQDEERQAVFAKIDRSFNTYKSAVERNLGDEVTDWLFCPLCASGAVVGYVNRHDLGRIPDEVAANVQTFLGYQRETEYPSARGINVCDDCAGLGKVATGSRVSEHMTITCPTCKGYGYTPPPGAGTVLTLTNGSAGQDNAAALADLEQPDRDAWGEPKVLPDGTLNGNYGKMPQFKQVHPVYGVTANLSPEELISG